MYLTSTRPIWILRSHLPVYTTQYTVCRCEQRILYQLSSILLVKLCSLYLWTFPIIILHNSFLHSVLFHYYPPPPMAFLTGQIPDILWAITLQLIFHLFYIETKTPKRRTWRFLLRDFLLVVTHVHMMLFFLCGGGRRWC